MTFPVPTTIAGIHARAEEILDYAHQAYMNRPADRHPQDWHSSWVYQNCRDEAAKLLPTLSTLLCGHPEALLDSLPVGPDDPEMIEAVWLLSATVPNDWATTVINTARLYAAHAADTAAERTNQ